MAQNRKKAPQPPTRGKAGSDKAKKGGKNKGGLWQRIKNAWGAAHDKIDDLKNDRSFMRTWRVLRPVSIRLISLLLVIIIISCVFNTVNSKMFAPVDKNNNEPVMLVVGSGSSMSAVASKLQKMGLINSKWGIKLLADFTNRSGKVKAGEYILDRTMSANEILEILTQPSPVRLTVTVTITEGMNLESIAKLLQEKEVIENAQSFLEQCNDLTAFESFSFVSGLKNRQSVRYQLEGYLFPDTYNFYVGSSNASAPSALPLTLGISSFIMRPLSCGAGFSMPSSLSTAAISACISCSERNLGANSVYTASLASFTAIISSLPAALSMDSRVCFISRRIISSSSCGVRGAHLSFAPFLSAAIRRERESLRAVSLFFMASTHAFCACSVLLIFFPFPPVFSGRQFCLFL